MKILLTIQKCFALPLAICLGLTAQAQTAFFTEDFETDGQGSHVIQLPLHSTTVVATIGTEPMAVTSAIIRPLIHPIVEHTSGQQKIQTIRVQTAEMAKTIKL
jgi:hypothetical protein